MHLLLKMRITQTYIYTTYKHTYKIKQMSNPVNAIKNLLVKFEN